MGLSHHRRQFSQWFWITVVWLGFSILNATQIVVGMRAVGMQHAWGRLFAVIFLSWIVWALATPIVLQLGHKYPPTRLKPVSTWLVHLGCCMVVAVIYSGWAALLQQWFPPWGKDFSQGSFTPL